ncbi:hypothetical protein LX32DRAFT_702595 [Colletotrichum zoysiae]|uniref:Uncharacterized protein n=1 Tax=Colletotrichum zoysiae TaxID=1216348 RepID=A0AAD9HDA8_9PEZI|nr:hypothetical protein LX32DRAFT_702595 [Colletotrichum zoysiae]
MSAESTVKDALHSYLNYKDARPDPTIDYRFMEHPVSLLSPIHGSILSNGVGTGKTNIMLGFIHAHACVQEALVAKSPDLRPNLEPSLLVVQSQNIDQFAQKARVFGEHLNV